MLGFDLSLTLKHRRFEQEFIDMGRIGAGGFAKVHKVQCKLDQQLYALKIIEIKPNECKSDLIETIHKFLDEVKILSYLNHKNIIQYYGCWVEADIVDQQNQIQYHLQHDHNLQQDQEIVMIMEEDFSSNGIQFEYDQDSFQTTSANQNNLRNSSSRVINQKNTLKIPLDHSAASASIRSSYKSIRIQILSQLAESNLQTYLYQRNISKKQINTQKPHTKLSFCSPIAQKDRFVPEKFPQKDDIIENYRMIIQIIEGLQYLHSKKVIHRDVKLHNIVIDKNRVCKIIDYGLAKKARMLQSISEYPTDFSSLPNSSQQANEVFSSSVGTRIYSSPQQISSEKYDHRTDIYSLAIVILMFFCDFTTNHEELQIIEKIRKNDLSFIQCDNRLKEIMSRCLSQEKQRPRLCEIRTVVRTLLRQKYVKDSKKLSETSLPYKQNALEKEQNIYIVQNSKLKKKMSRDDFFSLGLVKQQSSTSSNSRNSENQLEYHKIQELNHNLGV